MCTYTYITKEFIFGSSINLCDCDTVFWDFFYYKMFVSLPKNNKIMRKTFARQYSPSFISITEELLQLNTHLYLLFVDFKQLFDNLSRKVRKIVFSYDINKNIPIIIVGLYHRKNLRVVYERWFSVASGDITLTLYWEHLS